MSTMGRQNRETVADRDDFDNPEPDRAPADEERVMAANPLARDEERGSTSIFVCAPVTAWMMNGFQLWMANHSGSHDAVNEATARLPMRKTSLIWFAL